MLEATKDSDFGFLKKRKKSSKIHHIRTTTLSQFPCQSSQDSNSNCAPKRQFVGRHGGALNVS